jgi:hypothetical protein
MKFAIIIAFLLFSNTNDLLLNRQDVSKAVSDIKCDSFGPLHIEYALLVTNDDIVFVAGSGEDVRFPIIPGLLAIIHTHPDKGFEKPSAQDIKTAHELCVPVYTISRGQVWEALPSGEIVQK